MERTFSAGTVILGKNTISNLLFVIVRGKVKLESDTNTFFLTDSDFFGEECAFLKKASFYSAVAAEETVIQIFDIQEARDYIFNNPKVFFPLFVRNLSRAWDSADPISENHPAYIGFIEKIFPYVTKNECESPTTELGITIEELSARTGMESSTMLSFILSIEHLGHIKIEKNGKMLSIGRKDLQKLAGSYYEKKNFALMPGLKGCGFFPLLNNLREKEI